MNVKALLGAAVGALLGALIWALIGGITGYEVGYVAWGVGALVGIGARLFKASDVPTAVACAALAAGAIFAGKCLAVNFAAGNEIQESLEAGITRESYDKMALDAVDFAQLGSEDEYAAFMVSHGYTEAKKASGVKPAEIEIFTATNVPGLEKFQAEKPEFGAWKASVIEEIVGAATETSNIIEAVAASIGPIDAIFAILGIATAFRVARGGSDDVEE